jgi:hypothetical protein
MVKGFSDQSVKALLRQHGPVPSDKMHLYRNALAGGKVIVDLMENETYADLCTITLDFEGDGITPVMNIHTTKWVPRYSPQNLQHVWNLDMDEVFGQDNADNSLLRQIVRDIEYAMRAEEEARDKAPARKRVIEI